MDQFLETQTFLTNTTNVLGSQVLFYFTAGRSGIVTIQSNVAFCDVDLVSQQINITIEEQRNETRASTYVTSNNYSLIATKAGIYSSGVDLEILGRDFLTTASGLLISQLSLMAISFYHPLDLEKFYGQLTKSVVQHV